MGEMGPSNDDPIVASSAAVAGKHTARGALVNLLGALARLPRLIFWIVAIRLYGASAAGDFAVAFALLELIRQFASSGIADGVVLFLSRDLGREGEGAERREATLSTAIWLLALIGGTIGLAAAMGGDVLAARLTRRPVIEQWVPILVGAVPLLALAETLVAATRAHMVMKWHAIIMGGVHSTLLLVLAALFRGLGYIEDGLAWAWLLSAGVTTLIAAVVFGRYFDICSVLRSLARPRWNPRLLRFVVPQNLNMTFNYFATSIDLLLLGAFAVASELIAFYTAGIQITRNLNSIKVAYGASLGPVTARFHVDGRTSELRDLYAQLSRQALSIALALTLFVGIMRDELLGLFDPAFRHGNEFVLVLLALPIVVCAVGLAGNLVVMSGRASWNLLNSVVGGLANLGLNIWLIPLYGIWGAAVGTLLATVLVQAMAVAEAAWLLGIRTELAPRLRPLGVCVPAALLAVLLGSWSTSHGMTALSAIALYGALLWAFVLDSSERARVRHVLRRRRPTRPKA